LFVAEGLRTVEELLRSPIEVRGVLATPQLVGSPRGQALLSAIRSRKIGLLELGESDFKSVADTDSPQGMLAIAVVPPRGIIDVPRADSFRILVLDSVQDPGNVGTIIRSAAALGAAATVCLPGTVDLWNAKVVRSAMGAHFHHLCFDATWDDVEAFRRERDAVIWGADVSGEAVGSLPRPARLALVVGNEGSGLSSLSRQRADCLVSLPITASADSLNVAVAASLFLYELCR